MIDPLYQMAGTPTQATYPWLSTYYQPTAAGSAGGANTRLPTMQGAMPPAPGGMPQTYQGQGWTATQTSTPYTPGQAPGAVPGGYTPATQLPGVTQADGQPNGVMARDVPLGTGAKFTTPGATGYSTNDIRSMAADPTQALGTPMQKYLMGGSLNPGTGNPLYFKSGKAFADMIHANNQARDPFGRSHVLGSQSVGQHKGEQHAPNAGAAPSGVMHPNPGAPAALRRPMFSMAMGG